MKTDDKQTGTKAIGDKPMIELVITDKSLKLVPNDLEALRDAKDMYEVLESHTSNGWLILRPEQCGAFTNGIVITDDWIGENGHYFYIGVVYWETNYQINNTLEKLQKGETVEWPAV